mgnify:CR=1 FL=1
MKIINLLNGKEFAPFVSIKERLGEASKSRSLICTNKMRGIGKTSSLIEFAKEHRYTVVIPSEGQVKDLQRKFDYPKIAWQGSTSLRGIRNLVIDEGVKIGNHILASEVITGFTTEEVVTPIMKTFMGNIVDSLKRDAISLCEKMLTATPGDYKMHIVNLERITDIICKLDSRYKLSEDKNE